MSGWRVKKENNNKKRIGENDMYYIGIGVGIGMVMSAFVCLMVYEGMKDRYEKACVFCKVRFNTVIKNYGYNRTDRTET